MTRSMHQLLEGIEYPPEQDVMVRGIEYNSHNVQEGDVFIAIPGVQTDGHDFIPQAIENGAVALVVEHIDEPVEVPTFLVNSSRLALSRMAANWFDNPAKNLTITGVTGTNGKTTVIHLLKSIFQSAEINAGTIGTLGYSIGNEFYATDLTTPDSLELHRILAEMVEASVSNVAMEVSSHALVLDRVADIDFSTGIFTNLGRDHYDFHKTKEAYRAAKGLLFQALPEDGHAILNFDSEEFDWFSQHTRAEISAYSVEDNRADYFFENYHSDFDGSHGTIHTHDQPLRVETQLLGRYNLSNILASVAAAKVQGISDKAIRIGVQRMKMVSGRLELIPVPENAPAIYVDYAHTPDALESALNEIQFLQKETSSTGKIIVVFGCGGDRDKQKRPEMGEIASRLADEVVVTSDNPRNEDPLKIIKEIREGISDTNAIIEPDRELAIYKAIELANPSDIILIAGKGHEDYQIIQGEKRPFHDKSVVLKILGEINQ